MELEARETEAFAPARCIRELITDDEPIVRIHAGELALLELVMRRYNQCPFYIPYGILRDDGEAEEITQLSYSQGTGATALPPGCLCGCPAMTRRRSSTVFVERT